MGDAAKKESDALKSLAWARFGLKMESTESNSTQSTGSNHVTDSSVSKQSEADYAYQDDFEELDAFIEEQSQDSSSFSKSRSKGSNKKDVFHKSDNKSDADSHVEKGQKETSGQIPMEKDKAKEEDDSHDSLKPRSTSLFDDAQSSDSEPEGEVMFTEDQRRAMRELMAQKHDNGDYSDDTPEYNVKERLKELNAELAMEPDPDDRQHRVGFKEELIDLVAPPPQVSDDEDDSPRKSLGYDNNTETTAAEQPEKTENKKQFVVERDGKFDIVTDRELSSSERAMFNIPDEGSGDAQTGDGDTHSRIGGGEGENRKHFNGSSGRKENIQPLPPSKPRPNTANGHSRRSVHPLHSPRPQTASSNRSVNSSSSTLQDFNYNSPYAMSCSEKERAQERARLREQQKKEEERRHQEEEEYRRQESEDAFQAWLHRKMDDDRRRQKEDGDGRRNGKEDKFKDAETDSSEDDEEFTLSLPYLQEPFETGGTPKVRENEEAFRSWLKQKQTQMKREKLLKRREEQGLKDGYYVRSREECDNAYKEWLKKKYAEFRRHRTAEKERLKTFQSMARRSRKQQMFARAVRQPQVFQYVDFYGYRF